VDLKPANNEGKLPFLAYFQLKIAVLVFEVDDFPGKYPRVARETCIKIIL
jgi:hypothetical protein